MSTARARRHGFPKPGVRGLVRLLVATSLEHPELPLAELAATFAGDGIAWNQEHHVGRLVIGTADADQERIVACLSRLGMSHEAAKMRFQTDAGPSHLRAGARAYPLEDNRPFAVRADRVAPELRTLMRRADVEQTLGAEWTAVAPVSLEHPERVVRTWLSDEDAFVGDLLWTNDRSGFEARASKHRPFFSPVSGHPRWMRAIINLARVPAGATVYDPLCGTGGILIEGALSGRKMIGSDLDPAMVEGSKQNLAHFDAEAAALFACDVQDAAEELQMHARIRHVDAVVTDLPYGQSASTGKVDPAEVARWTLAAAAQVVRPGGRVVVGAADATWLDSAPAELTRSETYATRVHKSLTRTYAVFERA